MRVFRWNRRRVQILLVIGAIALLIYWRYLKTHTDSYSKYRDLLHSADGTVTKHAHTQDVTVSSLPKLAVIVPFRDRFEELMEFVPHIDIYLNNQSVNHQIFIINQADKLRFNRAALINIGYHISKSQCDYLVMHDVDLLPLHPKLNYGKPDGHVFHVAAPYLHPLYHYEKFVGGILIMTHSDFLKINGLSNRYWGWGREDDEFYVRMKREKLEIKRPDPLLINTGLKTFRHIHDRVRRPRDNKRYGNQKEAGRFADHMTGVNTVKYNITEVYEIKIQESPALVYNVELYCDREDTPWCEHPS